MSWFTLIRLVRDVGLEVVLPIVKALHAGNELSAKDKLNQALTARAAGRAAYDASKSAGRP